MTLTLKNLEQLKSNNLMFLFNSGHSLSLDYSKGNLLVQMVFTLDDKNRQNMNGMTLAFDIEEETTINSKDSPCEEHPTQSVFK